MANLVEEIMSRELFTARLSDQPRELVGYYAILGIGASPVLDEGGNMVGMISLRDLVFAEPRAHISRLMSSPVASVGVGSSIEEAARILGETGYHRLPVVDSNQRLVGIVSSLDVVRGLRGLPARHPETFPHPDPDTGLSWSDDVPLELDRIEAAPSGPGIVAILHGGVGVRERVVWAEMADDMRTRLLDMLTRFQDNYPALRHWLQKQPLRFRTATVTDKQTGHNVVDVLQRRSGYARL